MVEFEIRDKQTNKLYGTLTVEGYHSTDLVEFVWNHLCKDLLIDVYTKGPMLYDIVQIMNNMGFDADFCPVDDSNYTLLV